MSYLGVEIPTVVSRSFGMGHSDPSRLLHISVSLPPRDSQGLQAYADSVSNPTSPNYHRFISPEEVGRKFGLPVNAINSVVGHLKTNGMTIRLIGKNRLSILADGTVSQAEKAFQTTINEYSTIFRDEAGKSEYFSFAKPLQVPSSLAHYVVDVQGLQSFTRPQPRALTPTQARSLYSLATSYSSGYQGQGRVTAISNWDGFQFR